jgi:hypothetical protein
MAFYGSRGLRPIQLTLEDKRGELVLTEPWKREKRRRRGVDGEVRAAVAAGLAEEGAAGVAGSSGWRETLQEVPAEVTRRLGEAGTQRRWPIKAAEQITGGGVKARFR